WKAYCRDKPVVVIRLLSLAPMLHRFTERGDVSSPVAQSLPSVDMPQQSIAGCKLNNPARGIQLAELHKQGVTLAKRVDALHFIAYRRDAEIVRKFPLKVGINVWLPAELEQSLRFLAGTRSR